MGSTIQKISLIFAVLPLFVCILVFAGVVKYTALEFDGTGPLGAVRIQKDKIELATLNHDTQDDRSCRG